MLIILATFATVSKLTFAAASQHNKSHISQPAPLSHFQRFTFLLHPNSPLHKSTRRRECRSVVTARCWRKQLQTNSVFGDHLWAPVLLVSTNHPITLVRDSYLALPGGVTTAICAGVDKRSFCQAFQATSAAQYWRKQLLASSVFGDHLWAPVLLVSNHPTTLACDSYLALPGSATPSQEKAWRVSQATKQ